MAKSSGIGDRLFVGGFDLSGDVGSLGAIRSVRNLLDVTGIDKGARERIQGHRDGNIDYTGFFNDAAGQLHARASALPSADVVLLYAHGSSLGGPAAGLVAKQVDYTLNRGADGSLTVSVPNIANGFGLEWLEMLTAGQVTHAEAANGTGIDGGASSAFGLSAYIQVLSLGSGDPTVKLQDSADDETYADITGATFGVVAADTAARIQLDNDAAVDQYVRVISTGTFTDLAFICAFHRCLNAEW